jgi:hypothetical protein
MPHTSHPKAASVKTADTGTPVYQHVTINTAIGESKFITRRPTMLAVILVIKAVDFCMQPMKLSGAQSRPIINESEKFNVARAERKIPKRRSEKDFMRRYC